MAFGKKFTIDTVLKRAMYPALEDLRTLLDAYSRSDPYYPSIQADIAAVKALDNVRWADMNADQKQTVMLLLTHAEQWEAGLTDSLGNKDKYGKEARRAVDLYKHYRRHMFGKNQWESFVDNSIVLIVTSRGLEKADGTLWEPPTKK